MINITQKLEMSRSIAGNACVWWKHRYCSKFVPFAVDHASGRTISWCTLGTFPLIGNFQPRILAQVGYTTVRNLLNCVWDSWLWKIVRLM